MVPPAPPATNPELYRRTIRLLRDAGVPFLVGGAYAFRAYTGIERHTKDLDLFVRRADIPRALEALEEAGYEAEVTYPHWLAKARQGEDFVDLIFRSGNGVSEVNDGWFERAPAAEVFGEPIALCPPEEIIWTKAFIMERERFDGADVHHLLLRASERLDWEELLQRFDPHFHVLLAHLVLFRFAYPSERERIPAFVIERLVERFRSETEDPLPGERVCRGTLLSRAQYLVDIQEWGFRDSRLDPDIRMSPDDIAGWTDAIGDEEGPA